MSMEFPYYFKRYFMAGVLIGCSLIMRVKCRLSNKLAYVYGIKVFVWGLWLD